LEALFFHSYTAPNGQEIAFGGRDGTMAIQTSRGSRLGGVACAGRRVPHVEVRAEGMLDVATSLQEASPAMPHCNKVAVVFAGHPAQVPRGAHGIGWEESELLGRTTWGEVFFTVDSQGVQHQRSDQAELPHVGVTKYCDSAYIQAGTPECIIAENVMLLRHASPSESGAPGPWRAEPRELSAICFLPEHAPQLSSTTSSGGSVSGTHCPGALLTVPTVSRQCVYADKSSRICYRSQVEAVVKACCLLDCDGLVVGCAEGICGSELFGHPMAEVVQLWRDVLDKAASHFRVVAFALGKDTPLNRKCTTGFLAEVLGARPVS